MIFTSLDLVLHTEALLSAVNFLSVALSPDSLSSPERETRTRTEHRMVSAKSSQYNTHTHMHSTSAGPLTVMMCFLSATPLAPADSEVIKLKLMMALGAFNVLVCDQSCNMADIKIQGRRGAGVSVPSISSGFS